MDSVPFEEMEEVLAVVEAGMVAVLDGEGFPEAFPVNFATLESTLYFHGAPDGSKMQALRQHPQVGFTAVDAGSLIPSYWRHPRSASPATQFFRSVMIRGTARVVEQAEEKAQALQALMEKLQPEGGHEPVMADDPLYTGILARTGLVAVEPVEWRLRINCGQKYRGEMRESVMRGLRERGTETALRTLGWMEQFGPDAER